MSKIPELYKNKNINPVNNNKKLYRIMEREIINKEEIKNTLDNIFDNYNYYCHKKINIITKNNDYKTFIIARNKNSIFTLENEEIPITDIIEIKDCSHQ